MTFDLLGSMPFGSSICPTIPPAITAIKSSYKVSVKFVWGYYYFGKLLTSSCVNNRVESHLETTVISDEEQCCAGVYLVVRMTGFGIGIRYSSFIHLDISTLPECTLSDTQNVLFPLFSIHQLLKD